ncbi:hypothetical protein ATL39_0481 [Sinobaca qinghaiensis]|uniref:Uncharacterized protein n=1 Tax=Sinobaca qinghaiensis TaxID=342944 RepID=A0A419V821_9BACL|nr:hypothetical protein ATL39_0481 [Sinobaca qinghaiensis]
MSVLNKKRLKHKDEVIFVFQSFFIWDEKIPTGRMFSGFRNGETSAPAPPW